MVSTKLIGNGYNNTDILEERVSELTNNLRDTDWMVLEILEHKVLVNDDTVCNPDICNKRKAWRREISELSKKIEEYRSDEITE